MCSVCESVFIRQCLFVLLGCCVVWCVELVSVVKFVWLVNVGGWVLCFVLWLWLLGVGWLVLGLWYGCLYFLGLGGCVYWIGLMFLFVGLWVLCFWLWWVGWLMLWCSLWGLCDRVSWVIFFCCYCWVWVGDWCRFYGCLDVGRLCVVVYLV